MVILRIRQVQPNSIHTSLILPTKQCVTVVQSVLTMKRVLLVLGTYVFRRILHSLHQMSLVSINPNHFLVDVAIQCVMDDEICEDKESQTEISVNPNSLPVDISIQCDMFDEIPDKENSLPDNLCTGNNDESFFLLFRKTEGFSKIFQVCIMSFNFIFTQRAPR